jgi:hypothetical protein
LEDTFKAFIQSNSQILQEIKDATMVNSQSIHEIKDAAMANTEAIARLEGQLGHLVAEFNRIEEEELQSQEMARGQYVIDQDASSKSYHEHVQATSTLGNEEIVEEIFYEPSLEDPLEERFDQFGGDLDLDKLLDHIETSNEPSLEDPLGECFDQIGYDLDLDKLFKQAVMFSEPSLEDSLEECFAQSECDLDLDKFLEQAKTSNEPSLEDPLGECFAQFKFDLDLDMIREQVEALLDSTLKMQIENGETTEISSPKSSLSAAKPLIVDRHEEEGKEEQVENIKPPNNPNVSNDKEVSIEAHSLINFPLEIHNEKLIVTREGITDPFWEIEAGKTFLNIMRGQNFVNLSPKDFK